MKRALIVGINYFGSECELSGCINDAINIRKLLIDKFNYNPLNIILLEDSSTHKPTKENIMKNLNHLIEVTKGDDVLFFSYSGHGSHIDDLNGDEKNNNDAPGQDDVLCPCDYKTAGYIVDDDLRLCLEKLPSTAKFRSFCDSCHSGTMFDLPYIVQGNACIKYKPYLASNCLSISGCKDSQTSCDAFIDNKSTGALTYILLKILTNVDQVYTSWASLLATAQHFMINEGYTQMPMLAVSHKKLLNQQIDL